MRKELIKDTMKNTSRVILRIPEDLKQRLSLLAAIRGLTLSGYIRMILIQVVTESNNESKMEALAPTTEKERRENEEIYTD